MSPLFRPWPVLALLAIGGCQQHTTTPSAQAPATPEDVGRLAEPELRTAIVCANNDYGCWHREDPKRHRLAPLPRPVRAKIRALTRRTWNRCEPSYEGPTKYADLFGPVYRLDMPGRDGLHLYVYKLIAVPLFRYRIVLILFDTKTDRLTVEPPRVALDFSPVTTQHYCPRPWIRFMDICGDDGQEVIALTGHHHGTDVNHITLHCFRIKNDLSVEKVLELRTAQSCFFSFPGDTREERYGYLVRTIEKLAPEKIRVTATRSRDKLTNGEKLLATEIYECGRSKQTFVRTSTTIIDRSPLTLHLFRDRR